jgi:hypothetical protein
LLAKDFTKQIVETIKTDSIFLGLPGIGHMNEDTVQDGDMSLTSSPYLYIQTIDRSEFGKAFRGYLVTELTKLGYTIAYGPEEAVILRWAVNKIHHRADRKSNMTPGTFTALSAIGAGVYKLWESNSAFVAGIGTGIALDALKHASPLMRDQRLGHSELMISFSISNKGILLARESGTYYVQDKDTWHYNEIADFEGQPPLLLKPKTFKVVSYK